MNKRIEELFDQALEEFEAENKYATIVVPNPLKEKFVELLIWEVVDQMEECFAGSKTSKEKEELWIESAKTFAAWNGAIKLSRDKIKERFEVEE